MQFHGEHLTQDLGPVVVTGASGFVGSSLVWNLRRAGHFVVEIDAKPGHKESRSEDILNPNLEDLIPEKCTIIHLAAISSDGACSKDPAHALRVNVGGTSNLIRASNVRKARKIVFASSEWVYGNYKLSPPLTEETHVSFESLSSLYASTKLYGEWLISNLTEIPHVVLRFGIVYGPRTQPQSWPEVLTQNAQKGRALEFGSGDSGRSFIHRDDMVNALMKISGSKLEGVYNLGGSQFITVKDMVAHLSGILQIPLTLREAQANHPNQRNIISNRLYKALQWSPQIDLKTGLQTLVHATCAQSHD